ncbi:MAG TPA: DUF5684 domain-containing protein [Candidatus Saccharimonadales bacterium]|nr:DUF5684 domain-containing protein [Candidatus Saccharimonadales bacterium]
MLTFAQYDYYQPVAPAAGHAALLWVVYLAFIVIYIVGLWKVFEKAGEAGWKSIIPIWNTIVELRIVGYSPWYLLVFLIPLVNIVFAIVVAYKLAKSFGYGAGMTILEFVFGIGILIMGFGDAKYIGPGGEKPQKADA